MRGFIAAVHLCTALYIGALMYRPAPVHARPVAAPSWVKTDKLPGRVINPPWPERIVQPEVYRNTLLIPSSCARLAAREGDRLPSTEQEIKDAKSKVRRMARKGDALAKECARDMEKA